MCSRTKLPQVPGMSQQEQDALAQQRGNLDQMQGLAGSYGTVMQTVSGLFNPDGTINRDALARFGGQVEGYMGSQQGIYDASLAQAQLEDQLYRQALAGTGPVTEGLKQQKQKDFETMKEAAGRRGIRISGSSWEDATSDSTAGIRMISEAQKRYDLAADNERQALRQWGGTQALNRMGALASFDPTAGRMGYLGNATMGMMPMLSGINQGWSGYMQPYQTQRLAQFQRDSMQAQADAQWKNSMWQGAGQLAGTAVQASIMAMGAPPEYAAMAAPKPQGTQPSWQGSYNQYAAMTGADPMQYAPPSMRMRMGG